MIQSLKQAQFSAGYCAMMMIMMIITSAAGTGCVTSSLNSSETGFIETSRVPAPATYSVYMPPRNENIGSLSVVIMLTDRMEKPDTFQRNNAIAQLHQWMETGVIRPAVLIVPHSQDGLFWNYFDQTSLYADFIVFDLIPELIRRYPVSPDWRNHHIFGSGTGANAAVELAVRYPRKFGSAGGLNGYYFDVADAPRYIRFFPFKNSRRIFGPPENIRAMESRSIYRHLRQMSEPSSTRFVLGNCGTSGWDSIENNVVFLDVLSGLGIKHDMLNFYGVVSSRDRDLLVPVFIAVQLGMSDIFGEIENLSWQVLRMN